MKSKSLSSTLVFATVLAAVSGCKKEETAPAPPPPKTTETAPAGGTDLLTTATTTATTTASNAATAASAVVTQAAAQAATQAQAATTAGTNLGNAAAAVTQAITQATAAAQPPQTMVQTVIDKAKGLVADQKYSDAMNTLSQLANVKLTPEQQTLVDSLKSQIQTALAKAGASDAASALGGILGGKK